MTDETVVVENTTPLVDPAIVPPGNGATPPVVPEIEKAIKLVELQEDLTQMLTGLFTLQKQVASQMGAIQYARQKIAQLQGGEETKLKKVEDS